jgi:hypothetical protein
VQEDFGVDVTLHIELPEASFESFESAIVNLTSGNAIVERRT